MPVTRQTDFESVPLWPLRYVSIKQRLKQSPLIGLCFQNVCYYTIIYKLFQIEFFKSFKIQTITYYISFQCALRFSYIFYKYIVLYSYLYTLFFSYFIYTPIYSIIQVSKAIFKSISFNLACPCVVELPN